jgi:hypothetical protein
MLLRWFAVGALGLAGCAQMMSSLNKAPAKPKTGALAAGDPGYVDPGAYDGPLAKKYAGKVVFSSAPIALDASDDKAVYASYTLGEPLYMRYWSEQSLHNLMPTCSTPRVYPRADVNGAAATAKSRTNLPSFGTYRIAESVLNGRMAQSLSGKVDLAFTTSLVYDPAEREVAGEAAVREFNSEIIPLLHEGTNTLHIVVEADCGAAEENDPVLAEGTIEVVVKPGAQAKYLAAYGPRLAPSPNPENAKLAKEILSVMKKQADWDNEELRFAQVISKDWQPVRNELGRLVAYQVEAALLVHGSSDHGDQACRLFDVAYRRDPAGGDLYFAGTGDSRPFPCTAVR